MSKTFASLFIFILFSTALAAQSDSLFIRWQALPDDTAKVDSGNVWSKQIAPFNPEVALQLAQQNLLLAQQLEDPYRAATACARIGWAFDFGSSIDPALYYYGRAAKEFEELGFPSEAGDNLHNMGVVYLIHNHLPEAWLQFEQTLEIRQSAQDSFGMAKVYNNLGLLSRRQANPAQALRYYQLALHFYKHTGETSSQLRTLSNINSVLQDLEQWEASVTTSTRLIQQFEQRNRAHSLSMERINLAVAKYYLGEVVAAEEQYRLAIQELEALPPLLDNNLEKAYHNYGSLLYDQGRINAALKMELKALRLAKEREMPEVQQSAHMQLGKLYAHKKQYKLAFAHQDSAIQLQKELFDASTADALARINVRFQLDSIRTVEAARTQIEVEKRKTAEMLQQKEEQRTQWLAVTILVFIVLLVSLLYQFRKNVRNQRQLETQNQLIEQNLAEKELLMREIHHRVKNNLQSIKSMINIQRRSHVSPNIEEVLNPIQNRVNAMVLVHGKLYGKTALTQIDAGEYLEELSLAVLDSFGFKGKRLQLEFNMSPLYLSLDALLNLGLVINELVTNACKYGATRKDLLELSVSGISQKDHYLIVLQDRGKGKMVSGADSFGNSLITALMKKLKGEINYVEQNGLRVELNIPQHES